MVCDLNSAWAKIVIASSFLFVEKTAIFNVHTHTTGPHNFWVGRAVPPDERCTVEVLRVVLLFVI